MTAKEKASRRRSIYVVVAVVVVLGTVHSIRKVIRGGQELAEMQARAWRAELEYNLDSIRGAQHIFHEEHGQFVSTLPCPRSPESLSVEAIAWTGNEGFDKLGWGPDGLVRGSYWVEVSEDGASFVAHGKLDADGDGVAAHFTATDSSRAMAVTPPDVY